MTGNVFEGHGERGANPEVVGRAYRTWIELEKDAGGAQTQLATESHGFGKDTADLSDRELIERICASRNGADIRALLDGDTSSRGGDHSAADMALCSHLAFWCAGDAARMDRIFRSSGLMQEKWDSSARRLRVP